MEYLFLIVQYALFSLFFKWLLSWGGAEKIEGWLAGIFISWYAVDWSAEQIRFYALLSWVAYTVLCVMFLLMLLAGY